MSTPGQGHTDERQQGRPPILGLDYILTDEERRVLKECGRESFWYRSVPLSAVSMAVTQALISRGFLSASPRFGAVPKLVFASFFGYFAGKISYMKVCRERIALLENSPLGEAMRQRAGRRQQYANSPQSEMGDADSLGQSFGTMFQSDTQIQTIGQSKDNGYGYSQDPPIQVEQEEDLSVSAQAYMDEEAPRQKSILYEDLRLKNRENYEVTLTQKAETPTPQREPERLKKEGKKNIYGDTWED